MTPSNAQQEAADRQLMVEEIDAMLASAPGSRGVARLSPRVRAAMTEVPRHEFVPPEYGSSAYRNTPLPIGHGQTISQPLIVALMTELLQLEKTDKVLEVGTGSGYQAAILSVLAGEVYTIEIVPELGKMARANQERILIASRARFGFAPLPLAQRLGNNRGNGSAPAILERRRGC